MRTSRLFTSLRDACLLTLLVIGLLDVSLAQVRSSPSYQLQSDSINVGGGLSTSSSYTQESTVGEVGTGPSDSTSYALRAGYQQMQEVFVSISTTGDVLMSPDLPGLTGGTSNGSTTVTVVTDSPSGYQLTIEAEGEPAMQRTTGSESIADYDAGTDPDFSFLTSSNDAHFGFAPQGSDVVPAFLHDGGACNSGSFSTAETCWQGLASTTQVIAEGVGANHPTGATTTVHFRVGIGSTAGVVAGVYTATSTVTALPL